MKTFRPLARDNESCPGCTRQSPGRAPVQCKGYAGKTSFPLPPVQQKPAGGGLPSGLKEGIEGLSGLSMDDVRVHYNSGRPAQLNALAYARGTDIHVAPGQEKHLPHEAWHIVQQKQGRVQPTAQLKAGLPLNNDKRLEQEADSMGAKALQRKPDAKHLQAAAPGASGAGALQRKPAAGMEAAGVVQRTIDSAAQEQFESGNITVKKKDLSGPFKKDHGVTDKDIKSIQEKLSALRSSAPVKAKAEALDMSDSDNWPTSGGMDETDAKTIAASKGWTESTTDWTCRDKSHTPKGKVYQSGKVYYGADNTGHVGWGFKVWEVYKGKELDYKGNISWDGTDWVHRARGTK